MNNENYSPMSKLKTIPLSLQASVLPKPFSLPHFSSRTFFSYCCTKIHIEARNSL